jgi:hypothetical protein
MYRIELTPGEVTVFRSIEELATGVRNGVISSKARIYHSASEKWLPIEFHPHYKQALDLLSNRSGEHAAPKRAKGHSLTFLGATLAPLSHTQLPELPTPHGPIEHAPAAHSPIEHAPAAPAPVGHSPITHAPIEHAPATNTPIEQSPNMDGPIEHSPSMLEPIEHSPAMLEPIEHSPSMLEPIEHSPAMNAPVEHLPITHASIDCPPAIQPPIDHSPFTHAPIEHAPVSHAPIALSPGKQQPIEHTPAKRVPFFDAPAGETRAFVEDELAMVESPRSSEPSPLERFAPKAVALPPVSVSPVFELPRIAYPEITPKEEPVAEQRGRGSRRRRPMHLVGAVILLALGGYASRTVLSFGDDVPFVAASTIVDRPAVPAAASRPETPAPASAPVTAPPVAPKPIASTPAAPEPVASKPPAPEPVASKPAAPKPVASKPTVPKPIASKPAASKPAVAPSAPLPPASSGFARALEPRAIVSTPAKAPAKPSDTSADSTAVAPPPIDVDIAVPALPGAAINAARPKNDSAMKKILRAVSGGKDSPQR